ncbi:hypothetical protein QOZ80_3AG0246570 [Eleusine coracana subsp. coracana]|nr:hypothetical protein QOZ80_3AG0246570 [Eleusine coracana subsp. coracana]
MAAGSRKEEERNERIVRGLLKLPPNRRCVNCNGLGPQYVCTTFWTFVCIACSGIHREFTHRVKSVSMSTFSTQEVEALQKGGNQRARESFLKDFDTQKMRLPDSSNISSLREFIKAVYVERRHAGGRFSERPPRDKQNQKSHEEEHKRASSYHSFSQSPPNDYQYEERHNGKQSAFLSRKPDSDRGHDGKVSVFSYSPHSLHEKMSEDGFVSESCGSRTSNCSGSSMGDTVRTAPQSPNFLDNGCFNTPVQQDQSNVQTSYGFTNSQMGAISAGIVDSIPTKPSKSSLSNLIFEDDCVHRTQKSTNCTPPSFVAFSDAIDDAKRDVSKSTAMWQHPVNSFDQSVDLFANVIPVTPSADNTLSTAPAMDNVGWATFDTPPEQKQPSVPGFSAVADMGKDKLAISCDLFSCEPNDQPTCFPISKSDASVTSQSSATSLDTSDSQPQSIYHATSGSARATFLGDLSSMNSEWQEPKEPMDSNRSQLWNSFDDLNGVTAHDPLSEQPHSTEARNVVNIPPSTSNPFTCSLASTDSHGDDPHKVSMDGSSQNTPLAFIESSLGGASTEKVTFNPFDADLGTTDLFMDVKSLQEALPNPDRPAFFDGLPEAWFSNSPCGYVPSTAHGMHSGAASIDCSIEYPGGLPCLIEQAPNSPLRSIPVGTVSTGNPFA